MNIKEFTALAAEEVLTRLREEGDETVEVRTAEVMKMNDQVMHGLTFHTGVDPSPTFYLNGMYELYTAGEDMDSLLKQLVWAYRDGMMSAPVPEEVPDMEFESARKKAGLRLLGMEYNREFLKTVPYRAVGNGYALICDLQIGASDGGMFSTVVTNSLAEEYGYDMDELFEAALENAWRSNSASLNPASRLMDFGDGPEGPGGERQIGPGGKETCYVLTTNRERYGAAALFYPGTQAMIAHVLDEDYIAIPSSLHEFIIIRASKVKDVEHLQRLVLEANSRVVGPEDVLSDTLLRYTRSTGELQAVPPCDDVSADEEYERFAG
ncbi:MAG: DUF5688 family protein [Bacillota bacterium]